MLNFTGSVWFTIGSAIGFCDSSTCSYWASFTFGIGALKFAVGSAYQIVMWKDEQFGLTFLAVLNKLGGPNGRPMVYRNGQAEEHQVKFSVRGATFIMVYILAACVSVYNYTMYAAELGHQKDDDLVLYRSFNALLPCIFAHLFLALNSAVIKTPKGAPFWHLWMFGRALAAVMVLVGTGQFIESLVHPRAQPNVQRPRPNAQRPQHFSMYF